MAGIAFDAYIIMQVHCAFANIKDIMRRGTVIERDTSVNVQSTAISGVDDTVGIAAAGKVEQIAAAGLAQNYFGAAYHKQLEVVNGNGMAIAQNGGGICRNQRFR